MEMIFGLPILLATPALHPAPVGLHTRGLAQWLVVSIARSPTPVDTASRLAYLRLRTLAPPSNRPPSGAGRREIDWLKGVFSILVSLI